MAIFGVKLPFADLIWSVTVYWTSWGLRDRATKSNTLLPSSSLVFIRYAHI